MDRIRERRKRYLIYGIAGLLCACTKTSIPEAPEEEKPGESRQEVRFDISALQSKGTLIMDVDEIETMGIFGYSTGTDNYDLNNNTSYIPNIMYNQLAEKASTGEWIYNPVAYWPQNPLVNSTFFAYSPHSSQFPADASVRISEPDVPGNPTLRYTIPEDLSEQQDILYAAPVVDKNKETDGGIVSYEMKHAMTWLAFVVAPVAYHSPNETYTVDWLSFMADNLTTSAALDLGTGQWSEAKTESVVYEFELTDAAKNIKPGEAPQIINPTNRLILFPIEIDGEKTGATVDLTFTYDPGDIDPRLEEEKEEYYYYIPFPTTKMSPGRIVVYMINISIDGISLTFLSDNRIEDWIEAQEEKEIEIF